MPCLDVEIPAPDGRSRGTLHVPDGDGPWPGVLMYPDAGGVRETFRQMGDHLAGLGYVVLIPDIYYRAGDWAPFDAATLFTDPQERARLGGLTRVLTSDRVVADAGAYADFLLARPEVSGSAIGTTGYCLGGRMSLIAAGGLGRTIAAAASFHGGRIAVADDPSSPHLAADRITATVYVAGAADDGSFSTEQAELLDNALTGAGVDHTVEFYPAGHGFAVPDNPTYDPEAAARHWAALNQLYRGQLYQGPPPVTPGSEVRSALDGRPALLQDASRRALRYLAALADRPVAPSAEAVDALRELDFPLPAPGRDPAEVLALLDEVGSPATVASAGPRYFGFVTGGTLPAAQAAGWLASAWDQNTALSVMSPTATALDAVALRWVTELLGLPAGTGGGFVTGATMANVTCLAAARDEVLRRHGWDAAGQGLVGAPPVTVVAGGEAHATVGKALGLIGLGRGRARLLPADDQGRIAPRDLPALSGPAIVCLQAGNVNSGASDPFVPLITWAREQGAWVHVDGAFGLWAAACPATAEQVAGVAGADSWATDAHKWLNTSYDCGVALVRDPAALAAAMEASAAYLPGSAARQPMHFTPQSSQRARGAEVWAALAVLGRDGVTALIDRTCQLARRFAEGMREAGFGVLNDVVLNQVVVDFGTAARTESVIAAIQREGTCWCGPTAWHGRTAMRVSVSGWNTTADDIDQSIAAVRAASQ